MSTKIKRSGIVVLICLLLFTGYLGYRVADLYFSVNTSLENSNPAGDREQPQPDPKEGEEDILNVLLVGVDTKDSSGRTDTIMLARYNKDTKDVGLISIPRDTKVKLPSRGEEKINHAHAYGGTSYLIETVEDFLDIPIHNYVRVNMIGFKNSIDILGGIKLNVERDMYWSSYGGEDVINIKAGEQVLNGKEALQYVRYRGGPEGDIGRARRQQKLLQATIDELLQFSSVTKINDLMNEVSENVSTDFELTELMNYGRNFYQIDWDNMDPKILPGESEQIGGIWYYLADEDELEEAINQLIED
ncbi:LCP family protein [Natranaerobius trueperi]|uniref:Cell envelope-related transcriptional attenuator domain-containing protein n=1 Tax=Natranaerobius trueperi TaxID=759412 RepID=A0A226C132_9FIRM|nr:LCP family protein [Natranaerobius trueperi]OWZ84963.1 hypothetical protein CDO51_00730 [Natranaerobius trueperi]